MKAFSLLARTTNVLDAAVWGGVLILAIVVLAASLWYMKRRFFPAAVREDGEDFLSLQQLRTMLAEGQITREEFERLKATVLNAARGDRAEPAPGDDARPNGVK